MPDRVILLVEDNADDEALAIRALKRNNIMNEVVVARDGVEALDILEKSVDTGIHLLLSDIEMPRMGGIELAYRVKAVQPNTQILLISGLSEDAITTYDVPNSATCFIQKPFPPGVLAHKVREILDQ